MTRNEQPTIQEATQLAADELLSQGWTKNPTTAEFTHPDGRRGRIAIHPTAPGVDTARCAELMFPARRLTAAEMQQRVNGAPAPMPILEF